MYDQGLQWEVRGHSDQKTFSILISSIINWMVFSSTGESKRVNNTIYHYTVKQHTHNVMNTKKKNVGGLGRDEGWGRRKQKMREGFKRKGRGKRQKKGRIWPSRFILGFSSFFSSSESMSFLRCLKITPILTGAWERERRTGRNRDQTEPCLRQYAQLQGFPGPRLRLQSKHSNFSPRNSHFPLGESSSKPDAVWLPS